MFIPLILVMVLGKTFSNKTTGLYLVVVFLAWYDVLFSGVEEGGAG